jgi:transposase InsO family protein
MSTISNEWPGPEMPEPTPYDDGLPRGPENDVADTPEDESDEPIVMDFGGSLPETDETTTTTEAKKPYRRGQRLEDMKARSFKPVERLNLLDVWQRSGLTAEEFANLVGLSKHTLYGWKKKFETEGPAGLEDKPRDSAKRQKLNDLTRRAILMIKKAHPEYGCERISYMLVRGPALAASPATVAKVLHEAGYVLSEEPTHKHRDMVRRFERAAPNQLWQTDLFTFILKRQTTRVYLVAFMDDHSRFIVGYGLHASQSTALTLEVLRAAISGYGRPEEILTDNGTQYVTWRGKSAFTKELEKRGIKQIVAAPRHPQTLGKIERFWGTLWRECLESAVFRDLADARKRIGQFIDHYNFQRPHSSLDGLVPADRFFGAASEVKKTLEARVAANALDLACNGLPVKPFYLTGHVGDAPFSIHAEGERLILTKADGREEIELGARDAGQRILDVVSSAKGSVLLSELRRQLPDLARTDVDAALRKLEHESVIVMSTSDPTHLAPEDKEAALVDPIRGALVSITAPHLRCDEKSLPDAVCPDGSPGENAAVPGEIPEEQEGAQ